MVRYEYYAMGILIRFRSGSKRVWRTSDPEEVRAYDYADSRYPESAHSPHADRTLSCQQDRQHARHARDQRETPKNKRETSRESERAEPGAIDAAKRLDDRVSSDDGHGSRYMPVVVCLGNPGLENSLREREKDDERDRHPPNPRRFGEGRREQGDRQKTSKERDQDKTGVFSRAVGNPESIAGGEVRQAGNGRDARADTEEQERHQQVNRQFDLPCPDRRGEHTHTIATEKISTVSMLAKTMKCNPFMKNLQFSSLRIPSSQYLSSTHAASRLLLCVFLLPNIGRGFSRVSLGIRLDPSPATERIFLLQVSLPMSAASPLLVAHPRYFGFTYFFRPCGGGFIPAPK
jgi:hypothetical protein